MKIAKALPLVALFGVAACGGSSTPASTLNPYLGTLSITSAATTNTCVTTHLVHFMAGTVDTHMVTAAGGDCLSFTNDDTAAHQPASIGTTSACPELDGPALAHLATFTTVPLSGPKTCHWQDALNQPGPGGGGGGGGY